MHWRVGVLGFSLRKFLDKVDDLALLSVAVEVLPDFVRVVEGDGRTSIVVHLVANVCHYQNLAVSAHVLPQELVQGRRLLLRAHLKVVIFVELRLS